MTEASELSLNIGVDISDLTSSLEKALGNVDGFKTKLQTGLTLDSARINAPVKDLQAALGAAGAAGEASGHRIGKAFEGSHASLSQNIFELRALLDESVSGRWRNFDGSLVRLIGLNFQWLAGLAAANPAMAALTGALAAAGGAVFLYSREVAAGQEATDKFANALAKAGNFSAFRSELVQTTAAFETMRGNGVERLSDSLKSIAGVGAESMTLTKDEANKLLDALAKIPNVSNEATTQLAELGKTIRGAFGPDVFAGFADSLGGLSDPKKFLQDLLSTSADLTSAQRQMARAALESGDAAKQSSTAWRLLSQEFIRARGETLLAKAATEAHSAEEKKRILQLAEAARSTGDWSNAIAQASHTSDTTRAAMSSLGTEANKLAETLARPVSDGGLIAAVERLASSTASARIEALTADLNQLNRAIDASGGADQRLAEAKRRVSDELQKQKDLQAGGDALERQTLATAERELRTGKDGLATAKEHVAALEKQLAVTSELATRTKLQTDLEKARGDVRQQEADRQKAQTDIGAAGATSGGGAWERYKLQGIAAQQALTARGSAEWLQFEAQKTEITKQGEKHRSEIGKSEEGARFENEKAGFQRRLDQIDELEKRSIVSAQTAGQMRVDVLREEDVATQTHYGRLFALYDEDEKRSATVNREKERAHDELMRRIEQSEAKTREKIEQESEAAAGHLMSGLQGAIDSALQGKRPWKALADSLLNEVSSAITNNLKAVLATALGQAGIGSVINGILSGDTLKSALGGAAGSGGFLSGLGGLAGLLAFDVGSWEVPSRGNIDGKGGFLAINHPGEMILPATPAAQLRQAVRSGGSLGPTSTTDGGGNVTHNHNWNINAVDGQSVARLFHNNGRDLAKAVSDAFANNPSLRPSY